MVEHVQTICQQQQLSIKTIFISKQLIIFKDKNQEN